MRSLGRGFGIQSERGLEFQHLKVGWRRDQKNKEKARFFGVMATKTTESISKEESVYSEDPH